MNTLEISPTLRAAMNYPKFATDSPRILVGHSRYWVDDACLRAAERLGWATRTVPLAMEGQLSRDQLRTLFEALIEFKPDFILTANLAGMDQDGLLARFYADLQVPHATWFVDEPRTITMGRQTFGSDYAVAFTWERAYVPYLENAGFAEAHHLPLAADRSLFDAEPKSDWRHNTTFVGSSMTDFARRELTRLAQWPQLHIAVTQALDEGNVTRRTFGEGLPSMIDPAIVEDHDYEARRQAELVCFIEGTRRARHACLAELQECRPEVFGDDGWRDAGVQPRPPVDYAAELPALYTDSRINLNMTSIQMPTAVNQRVFDCPAAGGFLLTDAQSDLESLFDAEKETARYHDSQEARDLIRYFETRDTERTEITTRARTRILAEHTYEHRLKTMTDLLKKRFGNV